MDLEKENTILKTEKTSLKSEFEELKLKFELSEQYSRNRNLQLEGIPGDDRESISDVVARLSNIIGVPIDYKNEIQAGHRVPTKKKSGVKPIILQFTNRQKRDEILKKAKSMRIKSTQFVAGVPETFVYVNEHLTQFTKDLLFQAKQLKEKGFKYVWPRDGKVFVRKSDDPADRTIQIVSFNQLDKLMK